MNKLLTKLTYKGRHHKTVFSFWRSRLRLWRDAWRYWREWLDAAHSARHLLAPITPEEMVKLTGMPEGVIHCAYDNIFGAGNWKWGKTVDEIEMERIQTLVNAK